MRVNWSTTCTCTCWAVTGSKALGRSGNLAGLPSTEAWLVLNERLRDLPERLCAHIDRSRAVGRELSELFGVDPERVDFALAAHDLYRAATPEELLSEAARRGWEADVFERSEPLLLHGPVAALWLMQEAGVDDESVIESVTWHTTFAPNLSSVAATVFLADKIDPDKVRRRRWLEEVRDTAYRGQYVAAVELYLERLLTRLIKSGGIAHPRALEALNWFRLARAAATT